MPERTTTRRTVLEASGAAIAAAVVPATATAAESDWTVAETPVDSTLHDVAHTTAGAYAVGDGGVVVERTSDGWRKSLDGGPTGNGNDLYGAAVTDGRERLWFVGASGAIGEYDVATGTLENYSAPNDVTNNFNDAAAVGPAGEANVYVAGDSGKIYSSFDNGETFDETTPGSGASVQAVEFYDDRTGNAIDTNGRVFETTDGVTWEPIGIEDAGVNFYGLHSDASDDVWVSGGNGSLFYWNGGEWTPTSVGDAGLRDVVVNGDGYAVGGGGAVFYYDGSVWHRQETPTGENLQAVVEGDVDVAVGAGGTVIER